MFTTQTYCVVEAANHSSSVLTLFSGSGGLREQKAAPEAGRASQRVGFMPAASPSAEAATQAGNSEHLCLGVYPSCYPIAGLMPTIALLDYVCELHFKAEPCTVQHSCSVQTTLAA